MICTYIVFQRLRTGTCLVPYMLIKNQYVTEQNETRDTRRARRCCYYYSEKFNVIITWTETTSRRAWRLAPASSATRPHRLV